MLNLSILKKYYKDKKVFITGHTGFKGSYMCVLLKLLGAKVYGYSLKPVKNELYDLLCSGGLKIDGEIFADIRDYDKLYNYMSKIRPDYILHMAAQPLVLLSYEEPRYTYEVNVMGTVNLMEAVADTFGVMDGKKIKKLTNAPISILNVTTDKVYENNDLKNYAFKECDKLCGSDPYANSKSCSELVTYSYKKSFLYDENRFRVSTARAGNVVGGGDFNKNRIISDCYRAIKDKKDMEVRNPSSVRPYQYVLEPLIIYLNIMALQKKDKKYEGYFNIGPDKKDCLTTKELVNDFYEAWQSYTVIPDVIFDKKMRKAHHEASFLRLDNSLIKKVYNYKKVFNMKETMKYTTKVYYDILCKKNIYKSICDIIKKLK